MRRPVVRLLLATLIASVWAASISAQANRPQEYQVKAAYLFSFGKFVEWPATAAAADASSFNLCVLGQDPFGRMLDQTVAGANVHEKPVALRRIARVEEGRACHIVFISASVDDDLKQVLGALRASNVLTVGETSEFAERGGIVGFTVQANRVRFVVNLAAAEDSGLTLSSELLRVATTVLKSRPPAD